MEILGPVVLHKFTLEKTCQVNKGHAHQYDHVTFVQAGSLKVFYRLASDPVGSPERESRVFAVGEFFLTKANVYHTIKALEDGTRYVCVFTHRDFKDGSVVQEYNGNPEATN